MKFLYPLGFLALLAIPVLIAIYIIKNKYTEQVVSSTYLWTLSEKFLKRKNPINRITGIISLILQILAVILISFSLAGPVFTLKGAARDYCFILDGSGSMNVVQSGKTRFELGKGRISDVISSSADGSTYTLIVAGDNTEIIYENIDDKRQALSLLDGVTPSYISAGFADALNSAQNYFNKNQGLKTYLYTDKSYETVENAEVVNLSAGGENYALSDVKYSLSGGKLLVTGKALSYESDANITLNLYFDGGAVADSKQVVLDKLTAGDFTFESDKTDFSSLRIAIQNSDSLPLDNEVILFNEKNDSSFKTLIVSDSPFYIQSAFTALGNVQTTAVSKEDYLEDEQTGYGLYIYDGYTPSEIPKDGAVWFINPVKSVKDSGFSVQGDPVEKVVPLVYNKNTSSAVEKLLLDVKNNNISVSKYVKCSLQRKFTKVAELDKNPAIFAGTNSFGNREVVFAFDLQDADISLAYDFLPLVRNLISYTFPEISDRTVYSCGEYAQINVLSNCRSIRVDTPLKNTLYLGTGDDVAEFKIEEVGVYTVTLVIGNLSRTVNFFSQLPEEERVTASQTETSFVIEGEATDSGRDGIYDKLIIFFIIIAAVVIADWVVYCYEQYQL